MFCENRKLAEEWTYRYLATARLWAETEDLALARMGIDDEPRPSAAPEPEPSSAEGPPGPATRAWPSPTTAGSTPRSFRPGTRPIDRRQLRNRRINGGNKNHPLSTTRPAV